MAFFWGVFCNELSVDIRVEAIRLFEIHSLFSLEKIPFTTDELKVFLSNELSVDIIVEAIRLF